MIQEITLVDKKIIKLYYSDIILEMVNNFLKGLKDMKKSELLLKEIENLRKHLIRLVKEKGYTHEDTIKISQQLDVALNKYDNM